MHEKQIENLLKLSAQERLDYFVRHCADFEIVWRLVIGEDNWVIFKDHEGDEVFPLWPHKDLAEVCCFDEHKQMGAKPQAITLTPFFEKCVPDMQSRNIYFGVFYDKGRKGLAVTPEELKRALQDEIESNWL
ncbi:MAG: DUF2750 domain-containing protein [Rhizobiales bacterium]|nr:DUF2750 domain-containing protein [Hyphomicrobiales bacterium]